MHAILDWPAELAPLGEHLGELLGKVRETFDQHVDSDLPPVRDLVRHVERYRGKMLRPTLVLLGGLAGHPRVRDADVGSLITDEHLALAAVCEMVHMATLVHDDVLDEAPMRRRGLTVNHLHGNEPAVILGDHLIASAYHLCTTRVPQAAGAVARASVVMCEGELLQLFHREDFSLDEETYFEIIRRKTGELIACSARCGAEVSGATPDATRALHDYALHLGVAFQIQDDLLDLTGSERAMGKPVAQDIAKGKITLPLIHHLACADPASRARTLRLLEQASNADSDAPREIVDALTQTASVRYAQNAARAKISQAKKSLATLEPSDARRMLELMGDAVIERLY